MVDFDVFVQWAEGRFNQIKISGKEIKLNSIFCEDSKNHLWVNPEKNTYHCWKSDESGNIYKLVSKVDKCSYREAVDRMGGSLSMQTLEAKATEFFLSSKKEPEIRHNSLKLPEHSYLISALPNGSLYKKYAIIYLEKRYIKYDKFNLMVCIDGNYANRIVIPYYDKYSNLIYFNTRDLDPKSNLRYLGPDKETGVGKGDVIWMKSWPEPETKIFLTEGEFDAMILCQCDMLAGACGGKEMSEAQLQFVKDFRITLALDGDREGRKAKNKIGDFIRKNVMNWEGRLNYVSPPNQYKDWNAMYQDIADKDGEKSAKTIVRDFIRAKESPFTSFTSMEF